VRELVDRILRAMGSTLQPESLNEAQREIKLQYLSAAKARDRLGWKPLFTLEEGLSRTVAWYRAYLAGGAR
jgi:CDP-glucose 4,6-dehydratase